MRANDAIEAMARNISPTREEIYRVTRLIREIAAPFRRMAVKVYSYSLPTLIVVDGQLVKTDLSPESQQLLRGYEALERSAILSGVPAWAAEELRKQWHDKLVADELFFSKLHDDDPSFIHFGLAPSR